MTVQQISKHAKRTRKAGETWIHAIKRSAKELKGTKSPAKKKTARKKKKVGTVKRKVVKQTGSSSLLHDKRYKAKAPGKRKSASGNVYYERRKNRSDAKGKLSGVSVGALKGEMKRRATGTLAAGLLARDMATTAKQHKAAMKKIASARSALRSL